MVGHNALVCPLGSPASLVETPEVEVESRIRATDAGGLQIANS